MAETFDRLHLADDAATAALGAALGAALRPGDAVLLNGPVGAGKTSLARAAIAARLDRAEEIPSPTFTIVQSYEADGRLWHADLYRLGDEDELIELGLEEVFDDAIVFVEWPEKLGALTPARRLELDLSVALAPGGARGEAGRAVAWRAVGGGWDRVEAVFRRFGAAAEACP